MDKHKIGQLISAHRLGQQQGQKEFVAELLRLGLGKIDVPRLSRIEHGKEGSDELYLKICAALGIEDPDIDDRLRIGFSQGFWAAPVVWINEHLATRDFFEHASFTTYADAHTGQVEFSKRGERLSPFDPEKHSFFHSGDIADLLHQKKIDVGFSGSAVLENDRDVVRVARLEKANSIRHLMLLVAPKGKFANIEQVIRFLLLPQERPGETCDIYYQSKSTAEREFRSLLQFAGHGHNTIDVVSLPGLRENFGAKLLHHQDGIIGLIGLALSVEWAMKAVHEQADHATKYDIFKINTAEIAQLAIRLEIKEAKTTDFYYEMVVARNNEKIIALAQHPGFQLLLKLLRAAVDDLADTKHEQGVPLSHRKIADFFGLDRKQANEMLKQTEFELMYYPEWVNKVLGY